MMHFSITNFVLIAVALSSEVIARPVRYDAGYTTSMAHSKSSGSQNHTGSSAGGSNASSSSVGAAYVITNDPSGNNIVAMNIGSDGKLSAMSTVSTGGRGSHGISSPIGPDPLFSQGAVKVNAAQKILATVNAGSSTASVFSINPSNPSKLTMIGTPVNSGGEFPISLAINKSGNKVCVLNSGAINGVNCYKVDSKLGLVEIPNTLRSLSLNQTTPATGPAGTPSHVIFNEDESKLIASVKGVPPTPGFLATWDIANDDSLSAQPVQSTPASGGLLPFGMSLIPGTNAVLATDAGVGFEVFDFGNKNGSSASSVVTPISGQGAVCWAARGSKTGNFFLSDITTALITEVNVDKNLNATIVKQYQQSAGSAPIDSEAAVVGSNEFLYVLAANASTVDVMNINLPGKAVPVQSFNFGKALQSSGVSFSNFNLQGMATFIKN